MLHSLSRHLRFYHTNDIRQRETTQIVKVSYKTFSILSVSGSYIFLSNFLLAFVKVKVNDPLRSPLVTIGTNSFHVQKFYVLPRSALAWFLRTPEKKTAIVALHSSTWLLFRRCLQSKKKKERLSKYFVCPSVCNLVLATKRSVRFWWNLVFTQRCEASVSFLKIG